MLAHDVHMDRIRISTPTNVWTEGGEVWDMAGTKYPLCNRGGQRMDVRELKNVRGLSDCINMNLYLWMEMESFFPLPCLKAMPIWDETDLHIYVKYQINNYVVSI